MKTRTIKELLEIMLNNQNHFYDGLCSWVSWLKYFKIINQVESLILKKYIDNNRPLTSNKLKYYYWGMCEKEPRIEWLNEHIKLNS